VAEVGAFGASASSASQLLNNRRVGLKGLTLTALLGSDSLPIAAAAAVGAAAAAAVAAAMEASSAEAAEAAATMSGSFAPSAPLLAAAPASMLMLAAFWYLPSACTRFCDLLKLLLPPEQPLLPLLPLLSSPDNQCCCCNSRLANLVTGRSSLPAPKAAARAALAAVEGEPRALTVA
jgi:hypothetical protein